MAGDDRGWLGMAGDGWWTGGSGGSFKEVMSVTAVTIVTTVTTVTPPYLYAHLKPGGVWLWFVQVPGSPCGALWSPVEPPGALTFYQICKFAYPTQGVRLWVPVSGSLWVYMLASGCARWLLGTHIRSVRAQKILIRELP